METDSVVMLLAAQSGDAVPRPLADRIGLRTYSCITQALVHWNFVPSQAWADALAASRRATCATGWGCQLAVGAAAHCGMGAQISQVEGRR